MSSYIKLNEKNEEDLYEMCRLTKLTELFFDMTNWEFFKYIKDKEAYKQVCFFHVNLMLKILNDDTKPSVETDKTNG